MSFFRKLFGFGQGVKAAGGQEGEPACVEYRGFTIVPTPYMSDGQYQCCGVIKKTRDGEVCEHRFIRADRFSAREDANRMIEIKACKLIDEQEDALFDA